jgi:pyrroline-5-carboxylate reductase
MLATGKVLWLDSEEKIDALTAISGSGPAYVFHLMSCLQKAGESLGFSQDETRLMVQQTVLGAAQLAQNDVPFLQLQKNVTSKGGTTESALNIFHQHNLESIVQEALDAAYRRAAEISNTYKDK